MDTIAHDVRQAVRSLAKSKLFTIVALASLALGIGANVTVFSFVDALALKPLPYPRADRLVDVSEWSATKLCAGCGVGTSVAGYRDWKTSATSFDGMGAYLEQPFNVSNDERAERVGGALVSAETFSVLGIRPVMGRGFLAEDDVAGAAPVVILSHGLWTRHYGADSAILGKTIRVNGVARTVVGVMPPRFEFPEFARLWVPITPNSAATTRDQRDIGVVARLRDGVTIERADREMAGIAAGLASRHPDTQAEWTARVASFRGNFDAMPPAMYVALLGAVAFVLLIICANLAGLLLARGASRQREVAIRLALGASRGRIVRYLLTESVLLSLIGGGLGLLLALWGVDLTIAAIGSQAPFYVDFSLDGRALAYCLIVSIGAGLLFGLAPSLRASRPDVHSTLKDGATRTGRSRLRGMLVAGQLALAMILLAGAGELMKSFLRISAPSGVSADRDLLTGRLEFLDAKYRDPQSVRVALSAIEARLREMPGAARVATSRNEFIAGFGGADVTVRVDGMPSLPPGGSPRFYGVVSPDFFTVSRLSVIEGRGFGALDRAGTPPVAVINKRMASLLWPNESALGHRVKLGAADSLPWVTIVGVVADPPSSRPGRSFAYVSSEQFPGNQASLMIRASGDPLALIPSVRAAVRSVDADLPVLNLQTAEQQHRDTYWPYRMYAVAMSSFALFAILLAAIGMYGVIAYTTAQRTREIGVRIALGADARHVVRLVGRQGGRLVVAGVVLGLIGSSMLLRVLEGALFGASPVDLPVFAGVALFLVAVSMTAVWFPARRASRIDPLEALRAE